MKGVSRLRIGMVICFCLYTLFVYGQGGMAVERLTSFVENTDTFRNNYPQEKVYLHLDNTSYYLGETLWFKAYVMTSSFHRLDAPSKVLYVELLAPEGYVARTKKLEIVDGQCHGEFQLDSALYSGYFEIRAYTRAMLNFGDDCIFSRVIPVYDTPKKAGDYSRKYLRPRNREKDDGKKNRNTVPLRLSFFPEGGHLVEGIMSRVAFKAEDSEGREVSLKGDVCNDKGEVITSFSSVHRGMGEIPFCPAERRYYARVNYHGKEYRFKLPEVEKEGYVLSVNNLIKDKVFISVAGSRGVVRDTLGLAICCRGRVCYFQPLILYPDSLHAFALPKSSLPLGVNEVILFSRAGEPLCERKIFIYGDSKEKIFIKSHSNKKVYPPYEAVDVSFDVTDSKGAPVEVVFSLSVGDSAVIDGTYCGDDIYTNLLLSSEVKGFIRDADYYFEDAGVARQRDLDLLLLVQGWSRYPWDRICGREAFQITHPIEEGILMDGILYKRIINGKRTAYPEAALQLRMYQDTLFYKGACITDKDGRFNFLFGDLKGCWDIVLNVEGEKKKLDIDVMLNRFFSPKGKSYSFYERSLPDVQVADYISMNDTVFRNILLDNAEVVSKGPIVIHQHPAIRAKFIDAFNEITDEKGGFWTNKSQSAEIIVYLLNKCNLPGGFITIIAGTKKEDIEYDFDLIKLRTYKNVDSIIIYTDLETRKLYHLVSEHSIVWAPADSSDYTLFQETEYIRTRIPDYVVRLVSYPDGKEHLYSPQARYTSWTGYSSSKEFYSPDYRNAVLPEKKDYRRTLYWNPDVKTNKEGKASVHFYNNGTTTRLRISAETVTREGKIGFLKE